MGVTTYHPDYVLEALTKSQIEILTTITSSDHETMSKSEKEQIAARAQVRQMVPSDIPHILEFFRAYNIPELVHGLATYQKLEPKGHFVAFDPLTGQVLGSVTVSTKLDPRGSFIGFYSVRPGFQSLGIGSKIWTEMVKYKPHGKNFGLCSSPWQAESYRIKGGLPVVDPCSSIIHTCSGGEFLASKLPRAIPGTIFRTATRSDLDAIVSFDSLIAGINRRSLLEPGLFEEPEALILVAESGITIVGLGSIKPSNMGKPMISPLYATNPEIASCLLLHLYQSREEQVTKNGLIMYQLSKNEDGLKLSAQAGLVAGDVYPHLWSKEPITGDTGKIYAVYSPDVHAC